MLEWIALALLVPMVIVPVVLLYGYAGCDLVFKLEDPFKGTSIFDITLDDERDRNNCCLIVRLEPQRLGDTAGSLMKITVARPTSGDLNIKAMYVSHGTATGYDAEETPVKVVEALLVSPSADPTQQLVTLEPQIPFAFNPAKPLLIAIDIGSSGRLRHVNNVLPSDGQSFRGDNLEEAALQTRSPGYVTEDRIYLIARIQV